MTNTISVTPLDLVAGALLVIALAGVTARTASGLARSTLIAAARTTVQLLLVGLILTTLFSNVSLLWVTLLAVVMLAIAGREVTARQQRRFSGWWGYGLGTLSMFVSTFAVTVLTLTALIGPEPWYDPRYAIPLLGMVMGNTMTGVAVALDNLTRLAAQQRRQIEARLVLGHSAMAATTEMRQQSLHAGLIPIINAMAAAGVVSLPGMMTGQILAGNPPVEAVKYQILVMFLIAAGTGFGTLGAVWLGARRLFDERERLRLDRLRTASG